MSPIVISVGSSKGGVGKSTVSAFIASILQDTYRIGVIDADLYGPSLLDIWNIQPPAQKTLSLTMVENIACLSIATLRNPNTALIWRAPLLHKTIQSMLSASLWHNYDIIIVDLPPGTGDIALTLAQTITLTGHILITTPQHLSVQEGFIFYDFCTKMNIPVLGSIINMHNLYTANSNLNTLLTHTPAITKIPHIPWAGEACAPSVMLKKLSQECPDIITSIKHFIQNIKDVSTSA